jgi:hypothetical protein
MRKNELWRLSGILNEEVGGQYKAYETADSEIKTLTLGREILIRDVSDDPTPWKRLVVTRFVDGDHIECTGPKTGRKYTFRTSDCEIDLPGQSAGL